MNEQETSADIIAEMRGGPIPQHRHDRVLLRHFSDRLEAAHKRELDAVVPKPDPDWAEICAKCHDGEIEPKECEYYGEPNGCNSPIYGQHPKSKPCGNSAALREALKRIVAASIVAKNANAPEWILQRMADIFAMATTALAAPPRNCDVYDAKTAEKEFIRQTGSKSIRSKSVRWLYAPATEKEGGSDGK